MPIATVGFTGMWAEGIHPTDAIQYLRHGTTAVPPLQLSTDDDVDVNWGRDGF